MGTVIAVKEHVMFIVLCLSHASYSWPYAIVLTAALWPEWGLALGLYVLSVVIPAMVAMVRCEEVT